MAVPTLTPKPVVTRSQPARSGSRTPAGGGSTGRNARKGTGLRSSRYGAYTPAPPPATPFQPGAGPAPLLGPWSMLGLGLLVLGKLLWDALNWRPTKSTGPPGDDQEIELFGGAVGSFSIKAERKSWVSITKKCSNNQVYPGTPQYMGATPWTSPFYSGKSIILGTLTAEATKLCGPGTNVAGTTVPEISIRNASGNVEVKQSAVQGVVSYNQTYESREWGTWSNIQIKTGTTYEDLIVTTAPEYPDAVRPQAPTPDDAPWLPPAPAVAPAPSIAPAAVPALAPSTAPAPVQQPGQTPAAAPALAPVAAPVPVRTFTRATPGSLPQGIPAVGPLAAPAPLPVPVTSPTVVVVDGVPIGGPGAAPAPNLTAMAQELGRLEQKTEAMMRRPENGGAGDLSPDSLLGELRKLVEKMIQDLLNDVPGDQFQLAHSCPVQEGEDPPEPSVVSWGTSTNAMVDLRQRVNALAVMLQFHKDMGQPTCRTAVSGAEVTVHFEEA